MKERAETNEITGIIAQSRKYAGVDRAVIERLSTDAAAKFTREKDAVKAVKKDLHLIHGAFIRESSHAKAEALLEAYPKDGDILCDRHFAVQLMALHASTKERLSEAEEIYESISRYITPEDCIADIGCGFNPFALPFFTCPPRGYLAYDIDSAAVKALNAFFVKTGRPYTASMCDAAARTPRERCGALFMFKLFPLLERQKKGRAFELISEMASKLSIVSFPLKSASGKEKGMEAHYSALFESGLPPGFEIIDRTAFSNEMFYVVAAKSDDTIK